MKSVVVSAILLLLAANAAIAETSTQFDVNAAQRFAKLALACVHKEYPNKISHFMNSDADVAPPRKLTPAFYGCYDWHSSVHGHWLLARLAQNFSGRPTSSSPRATPSPEPRLQNILRKRPVT